MILGGSILQLPAIKKAKEMGLNVAVLDMDENAIGFKYADMPFIMSTIDIEGATKIAKEIKPDGVMTLASDLPMRTVSYIAKELNLVGVSEETAFNTTNKGAMRKKLNEFGVPIPQFFIVENFDEFLEVIKNFEGKFIVKPADNSGSRGIFLVNGNKNYKEIYDYTRSFSRSDSVLVEEYMEGHEVSVETIAYKGEINVIAITDKLTTGAPYFVEMGHSQPTSFSYPTKAQIANVAIMANKAVGIKNGPSHTEIKVTDEGPKIVEIGSRLGGDNITTYLTPLSTGVDMVEACIKIALGEAPITNPKLNKGSAIRYFDTKAGKIEKVSGIDKAKTIEGIIEIVVLKNEGDTICDIKSSSERIGYVIAQSETNKQAIELCNEALKYIKISIN